MNSAIGKSMGFFAYPPEKVYSRNQTARMGWSHHWSRRIFRRFRVVLLAPPSWARSFCPAFAWYVSQGVPSETRGSTCPNLCLVVTFSNLLRPNETSAVHQ